MRETICNCGQQKFLVVPSTNQYDQTGWSGAVCPPVTHRCGAAPVRAEPRLLCAPSLPCSAAAGPCCGGGRNAVGAGRGSPRPEPGSGAGIQQVAAGGNRTRRSRGVSRPPPRPSRSRAGGERLRRGRKGKTQLSGEGGWKRCGTPRAERGRGAGSGERVFGSVPPQCRNSSKRTAVIVQKGPELLGCKPVVDRRWRGHKPSSLLPLGKQDRCAPPPCPCSSQPGSGERDLPFF